MGSEHVKQSFQKSLRKKLTSVSDSCTIIYMNNAKEALMTQTTTIITGNNAGAKFYGAGSLRMARAAASGRKAVIKFVNGTVTTFTVWTPNGEMVGSYGSL